MSSSSIIYELSLSRLVENTDLSASALWLYDYLQTLPMEVEAIWLQKFTGTSFLFYLNRYLQILAIVSDLAEYSPACSSDSESASCDSVSKFKYLCCMLTIVSTSALFTLRAYALWGKQVWIVVVASLLILGRLGVDFWILCVWMNSQTEMTTYFRMTLTSSSLLLAFDTFIFVLTLLRTARQVLDARRFGQYGITEVVLKDGGLYFAVVFTITVVEIALSIISQTSNYTSPAVARLTNVLTPFYDKMPSLLVNRMVLNLKTRFDDPDDDGYYSTEGPHSMQFASRSRSGSGQQQQQQSRILGSIGEPLDFAQWDDSEERDRSASLGVNDSDRSSGTALNDAQSLTGMGKPRMDRGASSRAESSSSSRLPSDDYDSANKVIQIVPREEYVEV